MRECGISWSLRGPCDTEAQMQTITGGIYRALDDTDGDDKARLCESTCYMMHNEGTYKVWGVIGTS